MPTRLLFVLLCLSLVQISLGDEPAKKSAATVKVPLAFNRLYDYPELVEALEKLVKAHADLLSLRSLGKSVEGRDLWCVTVNNPKTGDDRSKPAFYVDGNIHGNEVQAAEVSLYLIWYLTENYDRNPKIRELVDERVFYVVPTVNPDGRAWWFNGPNTTHSSRSGKSPRDDDRDGKADEDGYDDLDGDGQIVQMRRKNKNGGYKVSPLDRRLLVPVKPGESGEYELLGMEGIDNDGDGEINEDPPGGYDMNRNWPADWQPDHVQNGAGDFPLSWPETKAVADFLLDHPNIAGVQAFHNAAGMILRGPGHTTRQAQYPLEDDRVAEAIGAAGAKMLPFYRNSVIFRDLYGVHGGFIGWTYEHLGIFSYTNELWHNDQLLGKAPAAPEQGFARGVGGEGEQEQLFANDKLLFGAQFVEWKPFKHPFYGEIELGGFIKQSQRVPPSFLIEELCHRNAAFVIHHADQMPRLIWDEIVVERLRSGKNLFSITAGVKNTRLIPSIARQASNRKIGLPDFLSVNGPRLTVVSGGILVDRDLGEVQAADREPARLKLEQGIAGGSLVRARWFVKGEGEATLKYDSSKGGRLVKVIPLK